MPEDGSIAYAWWRREVSAAGRKGIAGLCRSGLAAEGHVVIQVEQVEPGGDVLAFGRDLDMDPMEEFA